MFSDEYDRTNIQTLYWIEKEFKFLWMPMWWVPIGSSYPNSRYFTKLVDAEYYLQNILISGGHLSDVKYYEVK